MINEVRAGTTAYKFLLFATFSLLFGRRFYREGDVRARVHARRASRQAGIRECIPAAWHVTTFWPIYQKARVSQDETF